MSLHQTQSIRDNTLLVETSVSVTTSHHNSSICLMKTFSQHNWVLNIFFRGFLQSFIIDCQLQKHL